MLTKLARVATKIVGVSRDYAGFCCVTGVGAGRQWLTEPAIEPNSGSGISRSAQFRALSSAAIRGAAKYDPAFDIPYNGTPRIDRQASALGARQMAPPADDGLAVFSNTKTSWPFCRNAMADANPAKPPPTIPPS
jgi:hypothetical protein